MGDDGSKVEKLQAQIFVSYQNRFVPAVAWMIALAVTKTTLLLQQIPMDTKQDFFKVIDRYYFEQAGARIPKDLLKELNEKIANYYYEQYVRFRVQYPKSIKRYSTFKIEDLDHPEVFEIIIKFFKEKAGNNYTDYTIAVLGITSETLKEFENRREQFYNK